MNVSPMEEHGGCTCAMNWGRNSNQDTISTIRQLPSN